MEKKNLVPIGRLWEKAFLDELDFRVSAQIENWVQADHSIGMHFQIALSFWRELGPSERWQQKGRSEKGKSRIKREEKCRGRVPEGNTAGI